MSATPPPNDNPRPRPTIRHAESTLGIPLDGPPEGLSAAGLPVVESGGIAPAPPPKAAHDDEPHRPKIRALGMRKRHEDEWNRTPNSTGSGAIHVKTFHCKLTDDSFHALDSRINEWLDAHPQYEVKFVTTSVGVIHAKIKEPHMICQVWV